MAPANRRAPTSPGALPAGRKQTFPERGCRCGRPSEREPIHSRNPSQPPKRGFRNSRYNQISRVSFFPEHPRRARPMDVAFSHPCCRMPTIGNRRTANQPARLRPPAIGTQSATLHSAWTPFNSGEFTPCCVSSSVCLSLACLPAD